MSEEFLHAVNFISSSSVDTDTATKLELYSLFKYVTVSPSGPIGGRPSIFDPTGRAKWDAWKNASEQYQNSADAEGRYMGIARSFGWQKEDDQWQEQQPPQPSTSSGGSTAGGGMGISVSRLSQPEVDVPDDSDSLHGAAIGNESDKLQTILMNKTDVNARDEYGYTALQLAADRGHLGIVEMLLRSGADPMLQDPDGLTAQELAREAGHQAIVERLGSA